jgi:hypothetical protein
MFITAEETARGASAMQPSLGLQALELQGWSLVSIEWSKCVVQMRLQHWPRPSCCLQRPMTAGGYDQHAVKELCAVTKTIVSTVRAAV